MDSNGAYKNIFAFYFKLAEGKTLEDIDASTFRFETGEAGGFVDTIFRSNPEGAGIRINGHTGAEDDTYIITWGAIDPVKWPDTIEEVINPFDNAVKDTTPPAVVSVTPDGGNTPVAGSIVITFDEAMDTAAGTVRLNTLSPLTGGVWSAGDT
ncbi:MAG: Ig-like domain-containing protein, partial [Clostridiales bacterium]|nr:Ig-like domain-containing protein [Clostridiales bacterium]